MKKTKILDAVAVFFISVCVSLFLPTLLASWFGRYTVLISEILLILPAYFWILKRNESASERFGLKLPEIKDFFGAVVMFFGVNLLQSAATYFLYPVFYKNAENSDISLLDSFSDLNPFLVLVIIAIVPAICEELLFRGYFLSAFAGKGNKKKAALGIVITAILFSVMHFSIYKLPFTLIMGLAFGYIAYKTGSVLLGCIFHFISNANALITYYSMKNGDIEESISFVLKDTSYICIGIICLLFGVLLVNLSARIFSSKKRKKLPVILFLIISAVISAGALAAATLNETESEVAITLPEESYVQNFELDKNTVCIVNALLPSDSEMTILDASGESVFEYDPESIGIITLEKGSYTLSVETKFPEKTGIKPNYPIQIISFAEYEKSETKEDKDKIGGISFDK